MSHSRPADKSTTSSPQTIFRRTVGPVADELFFVCRPDPRASDPGSRAESAGKALLDLLGSHGGSADAVTSDTLHLRDIRTDLEPSSACLDRVLDEADAERHAAAATFIGQPPLSPGEDLELSGYAVVPHRGQAYSTSEVQIDGACTCGGCSAFRAKLVRSGDDTSLYAGNLYGSGTNAFEEAFDMFRLAEALLHRAGMDFGDVMRTWIYLRDIDRDYDDLNRARREFFESRGIERQPASTGIGGAPFPDAHDFSLGFYALKSPRPLGVEVMTTPTLNEARSYGADFSRGLKVVEANKVALYLSGTASIDEHGDTVHVDELEAQVDRMLLNMSSLLAQHGASFADVVSAVTYLRNPEDLPTLRRMFAEQDFDGFPLVIVEAPLCRPDLLCETEAVAALPLPQPET